jgi:O-antigen ligase
VRFYGRNVSVWRIAVISILLTALLIAAWIFIPGSLKRFVVLGLITLPVACYLLDRPEIVFYLFTFIIFSNADVYSPIPVFQSFALFTTVALALAIARGRKFVFVDHRFILLVVAFILLVFQSIAVARNIDNAMHVFEELMKVIFTVLITSQFVNNRRQFRVFLVVIVAAVVSSNLLPLFVPVPESYAGPSLIGSQGVIRYQGLILEPNAIAFLQVFCIPFYLFLAGVYRRPFFARWVFIGALLVSLVVIVMSFSRGSFIAFALLFLLLLYTERRNKAILIPGILIIVIVVSLVPATYIVRVRSIVDALSNPSMDYPIYTRLVTSRVALELGAGNPITGVGIGNFLYHAAHYTSFPLVVHNVPLLIFAEIGIIALGVFVAIIVVNVKILRKLAGRRDDREASLLGRMLLIQQAAVLFNALFLPAIYDHSFWYTLALPSLAAFAYRSSRKSET